MEEKTYGIGEVSEMFGIPVTTLRYYDKEGLIPDIERTDSGIRRFNAGALDTLRVIECLKKSGMEIKDIKEFVRWCHEGPSTYKKRREMFEKRKETVEEEIQRLNRVLDMINYKRWYYDMAIEKGGEEEILAMIPDGLPPEIRRAYDNSFTS